MARDEGVPMDLRDRLIRAVEDRRGYGDMSFRISAQSVFDEIERSGYRLVGAGRLERLQSAAGRYLEYCEGGGWDPLHQEPSPMAMAGLLSGDLEGTS